jgi:methylated-DNA-[protein]-cysteine S-methyltransferase
MSTYFDVLDTPLGPLRVEVDAEGALVHVALPQARRPRAPAVDARHRPARLDAVRTQLRAYFDGRLQRFELELRPQGTPFQLEVWQALRDIGYGATESYAGLAERIGRPRAVRAVGAANGANPLPIVVPCHRVIGADGSLTGFAGGIDAKRWLLQLERRHAPAPALELRG